MGDSTEFEKLTVLEARLAAALDRIAVGLGEAPEAPEPLVDPGVSSAALEDAQIRADAAEARVSELSEKIAALEGQIAAAAAAPVPIAEPLISEADLAALRSDHEARAEQVRALEAGRAADQDEARRAMAAKEEEASELKATLSELESQVQRLRAEATPAAPAPEAPDLVAMRAELSELRQTNEDLTQTISEMRSGAAVDPQLLNKALVVELDALRRARASEAAELGRILDDIEGAPAPQTESGHA